MAGTCFVGGVLYSADGWQSVPMLCAVVGGVLYSVEAGRLSL